MSEIEKTERGFHLYGDIKCSYEEIVSLQESSAASGPHCWLNVVGNQWIDLSKKDPNYKKSGDKTLMNDVKSGCHLNPDQARQIIEKLQYWLDEIPSRWDLSDE